MDIEIDADAGIATLRTTGTVATRRLETLVQRTLDHPAFRPEMSLLWDLRDATLHSVMSPEIHAAVETIPQYLRRSGTDFAVAIVVSRPIDFKIARLYEARAAESLSNMMVFYSIEEARAWLVAQGRE